MIQHYLIYRNDGVLFSFSLECAIEHLELDFFFKHIICTVIQPQSLNSFISMYTPAPSFSRSFPTSVLCVRSVSPVHILNLSHSYSQRSRVAEVSDTRFGKCIFVRLMIQVFAYAHLEYPVAGVGRLFIHTNTFFYTDVARVGVVL